MFLAIVHVTTTLCEMVLPFNVIACMFTRSNSYDAFICVLCYVVIVYRLVLCLLVLFYDLLCIIVRLDLFVNYKLVVALWHDLTSCKLTPVCH